MAKDLKLSISSLAALALMTGCSHQVIQSSVPESCAAGAAAGLPCTHNVAVGSAYSLPKGQVLLAASRRLITTADTIEAQKAVAAAKQAVAKDTKALSDAQSTRAKNLAAAGTTESQKAQNDAAVAAAALALESDKAAAQAADLTLSQLTAGVGKYVETAALAQLPTVPDPTARFVANLSHLPSRDDHLKLSLVNGLLTTTSTQSTDQTPAALVQLANAAVGIATLIGGGVPLVPGGAVPAIAGAPPPPPPSCEYNIATAFNPADRSEVDMVKAALAHQRANFDMEVDNPSAQAPAGKIARNATLVDGLVYRAATNVTVGIAPKAGALTASCPLSTLVTAQSLSAIVPDTGSDFVAPLEAGAFTASAFQYKFTDGMLVDYDLTRPSEVGAVADIPLKVVNSIMSIPTSILKLRLDVSTADTNLIAQQTAQLKAKNDRAIAILNMQGALETARATLANGPIADATARLNAIKTLRQAEQSLEALKNSGTTGTP